MPPDPVTDPVRGDLVLIDGIEHYRIDGLEEMEPFLTTVVSDSNLWLFASSTGVVTAGRIDADHAIFPYETDDRMHRAAGRVGPVTVITRTDAEHGDRWRPFGPDPAPGCPRSIAKSLLGDRLVFEEWNPGWGLRFRATWAPSREYGWVRTVELVADGGVDLRLDVLDGFVDVMPAGIDAQTERRLSNLADAYKRSEVVPASTLAVYSLESQISDRAEPAESLRATVVWSFGFDGAVPSLDDRCVVSALRGTPPRPSGPVTGQPGAYLLRGTVLVPRGETMSWSMVADTDLDHLGVAEARRTASDPGAARLVAVDVAAGSERIAALVGGADAFQQTAERVADVHHLSNVLFNVMRGGVFPYGHRVPVGDLTAFLRDRNHAVAERAAPWLASLGDWIDVADLRAAAADTDDPDLIRLVLEYLPLTFSRRHGDPSRPWNRFTIDVHDDEGAERLSYEGNWRDIFQNWEALLQSFPAYLPNVVAKFVNASTLDGHNPYRISRGGVDWEVPDPEDPWSNIGYWGDHQIVYLLRLLESWERFAPGALRGWLERRVFVYADAPYVIADHASMIADPRDTITFDVERAAATTRRVDLVGADGQLVVGADGGLVRVGLVEKLLVPALAKLSSFVPDGGIWMNTQRPEWNDANNALAGPGLSMVTLAHLRRYLRFLDAQLEPLGLAGVALSDSVARWMADLLDVFDALPDGPVDDHERRRIVDALGSVGSQHRRRVAGTLGHDTVDVPVTQIRRLCASAGDHLERTLRGARRSDGLYDSYDIVAFPTDDTATVERLGPMLEGQVAVLSSGVLDAHDALALIDRLFDSELYSAHHGTFLLYPVVALPSFVERNSVPDEWAGRIVGSDGRPTDSLREVFVVETSGRLRFRAEAVNARELEVLLDRADLPGSDRAWIHELYELVFRHHSFTGRSGRMHGYEGIGSVYWHMVGKLLVAVQENYWAAVEVGEEDDVVDRLADAYHRVRAGLGFTQPPDEFGAFPIDCYSHTPIHAGAQQPGMTGQVKEEILTRFGEIGLRVAEGRVSLRPGLLPRTALIGSGDDGRERARFTFCSVPMTITDGAADEVSVHRADRIDRRGGLVLDREESRDVFARSGSITRVDWTLGPVG